MKAGILLLKGQACADLTCFSQFMSTGIYTNIYNTLLLKPVMKIKTARKTLAAKEKNVHLTYSG